MIKPAVATSFLEEMKRIDTGLLLIWHQVMERYQVLHVDKRNGVTRIIYTIEDDDGNYIPCDNRTLDFLREAVAWDLIHKFPEPKDLMRHIHRGQALRKNKENLDRDQYRRDWNNAHRKHWRAALENIRKGIVTLPEKTKVKTISTQGISPGNSSVMVPVGFED